MCRSLQGDKRYSWAPNISWWDYGITMDFKNRESFVKYTENPKVRRAALRPASQLSRGHAQQAPPVARTAILSAGSAAA